MSAVVKRPPTRNGRPSLQRLLGVTQLRREIAGGAFQCGRGFAVNVLQVAVAPHDVEAGRVELGRGIEAPFEPGRIIAGLGRDQRVLAGAVGIRQIGRDRRALADLEIAVLQQRDLLPWIEIGVLTRLGLAGARQDRPAVVVETEFVQCPMGTQRSASSDAPQHQPSRRCVGHRYHRSL